MARRAAQQAMAYARSPEGKRKIDQARRQLAARRKPKPRPPNLDTIVSGLAPLASDGRPHHHESAGRPVVAAQAATTSVSGLHSAGRMDALTIHEAAQTTGWSPRMLRYVERVGLVEPARSGAGYRLYGPAELQRLRTLRELLERHELGLSDVAFALRLRRDDELRGDVDAWLRGHGGASRARPGADWLRWEQEKHSKLLAAAAAAERPTTLMETG